MSSDRTTDDIEIEAEYEADEDQLERNPGQHGKWVSGLIALIGLWVLAAPFVFEEIVAAHFWSDVLAGIALVVLGGYNYYRRRDEQLASVGVATLVALLGAWMIAAPFIFGGEFINVGLQTQSGWMFWTDVIMGGVVLLLGAYSAYEARDEDVTTVAET